MKYFSFFLILTIFVLSHLQATAQVEKVTFLNTGKMNVAPGGQGGVALYVPDAMRMLGDAVEITHNGNTELGGNFYHDATTHVFDLNAATPNQPAPTTPSTGIFRFVTTRGAAINRYITTQQVDLASFDRGARYIAFPNIEISTADSIVLPAKMGIDAKSLRRVNTGEGFMILRSDNLSGVSMDASLRVTNPGASAQLVTPGAVVVERDMTLYRANAASGGNTNPIFAFATPYLNTQYSGYYAGNWVRTPTVGAQGHVRYVLANAPSPSNPAVIDYSQYVINPLETLKSGRPYFVQPRPANFSYEDLINDENGLGITGQGAPIPSAYNKSKFYFNGKVYNLAPYTEQLFAEDVLSTQKIDAVQTTTVNWVIGNSYTSPLSLTLIAKTMGASSLTFSPYIYLLPPGSTGYQPCNISGAGDNIVVATYTEVPAMSIFMVRVSNKNTNTGQLALGKAMQVHSVMPHSIVAANPVSAPNRVAAASSVRADESAITNQVVFRLSPKANPQIYDLAAVGVRAAASLGSDKYDAAKIYAPDFSYQLFTLSDADAKLSINGVPPSAESVVMGLRAPAATTDFELVAQYTETLVGRELVLEDVLTGQKVDLMQTPRYAFVSAPGDAENRFIVRFKATDGSGETAGLNAYFDNSNSNLLVDDLTAADLGGTIRVYTLQGALVKQKTVDGMRCSIPAHFGQGAYIVQLTSNRTASAKVIKR